MRLDCILYSFHRKIKIYKDNYEHEELILVSVNHVENQGHSFFQQYYYFLKEIKKNKEHFYKISVYII